MKIKKNYLKKNTIEGFSPVK